MDTHRCGSTDWSVIPSFPFCFFYSSENPRRYARSRGASPGTIRSSTDNDSNSACCSKRFSMRHRLSRQTLAPPPIPSPGLAAGSDAGDFLSCKIKHLDAARNHRKSVFENRHFTPRDRAQLGIDNRIHTFREKLNMTVREHKHASTHV